MSICPGEQKAFCGAQLPVHHGTVQGGAPIRPRSIQQVCVRHQQLLQGVHVAGSRCSLHLLHCVVPLLLLLRLGHGAVAKRAGPRVGQP